MNDLIRCGEILVSAEERYEIHCCFCKKAFSKFPDFIKHRKKSCKFNQNEEIQIYNLNLKADFIPNHSTKYCETKTESTDKLKINELDNESNTNTTHSNKILKSDENIKQKFIQEESTVEKFEEEIIRSENRVEKNILVDLSYLDFHFEDIEEKKGLETKTTKQKIQVIAKEEANEANGIDENNIDCGNCDLIEKLFEDEQIYSNNNIFAKTEVSKEKPYKCPKCKNILTTKKGIEKHECPKPKNIVCKICGKNFTKTLNYTAHIRTHSDARPYICKICNYDFKTASHLNAHQKVHENEKSNECPYCDSKYKHKSSLNKHMKYVHLGIEKPHKCEKCNYRFEEKKDLRYHLEKIHGIKVDYNPPAIKKRTHYYELNDPDRIYKCNTCLLSCKTFQNIIEHRKKIHNEACYKCDCCDLTFTKYLDYQRHKFKPFRCSYCRKMIRNEQMKINHNCNKEFVCELCGKKFLRKESLRIHLKTHNDERQYKCKICNMSFKQSSTLYSHSFTHQIGEKVKCRFCQMDFKHNVSLRKHILRLHSGRGKSFSCHLCDMSFYTKYDRRKHQELKHKIPIEKKNLVQ